MGITFVNLSLLALGGLFVAIPILLHLAMRQKPKHLIFPALRFLQQRETTNRRRLQLRQWLLLLLRCLVVLLLALALSRPSVASTQWVSWLTISLLGLLLLFVITLIVLTIIQRRGKILLGVLLLLGITLALGLGQAVLSVTRQRTPLALGNREAPVAAALLLDTSPRMLYRYNNQTRLQRAQEISRWLIRQLPAESDVAIIDARFRSAAFAVDLGAASKAIDAIDVNYLAPSWKSLIEESLRLLQQNDKARKELYILSDLTLPTWQDALDGSLVDVLQSTSEISLQIIDVGVETPHNDAILDLQLSGQLLSNGSPLTVQARLARRGPSAARTVRLLLESQDPSGPILVDGQLQLPPTTVRGKQAIELDRDGTQLVKFNLSALEMGTHYGYVEVEGDDNLPIDNRRYFTVHVRPPWPVLVVAPASAFSQFLTETLAPYEFRETGRARFHCTTIRPEQLADQPLRDYAAVALLDPAPLPESSWQNLRQYVERGGGLALFLGRNASEASKFNSQSAMDLLPASIQRQWRADEGLQLAPRNFDHPVLSVFQDLRSTVPWNAMPIFRHWVLGQLTEGSRVVVPYSNNKPALVERRIGEGLVMLMTTPISDVETSNQLPWNRIANSLDSWPFLMLVDRMFLTLVRSNTATLNCTVGQTARLPWNAVGTERLPLLTPRGDWQEVTASDGEIRVLLTEVPGAYRLKVPEETPTPHGFSANLAPETSRLDRVTQEQLAAALGQDRLRLAHNEQEIVREIDQARIGREFYPLLLPVLALVMLLEYLLANRFYRNV